MTAVADPTTKLDRVLGMLDDVTGPRENGWYTARCPAHEDSTPSFGLRDGGKWIVWKCWAGCPSDAIRRALDLEWEDLVLDDAAARKPRKIDVRTQELEALACAARLQSETEVLEQLRFGRGYAAKALEMLGVGFDGSRLTLPVRDKDGKLHDVLRYAPMLKSGRKMIAGRGKSRLPWPAPEGLKADPVFIVEGEGTAISMLSIGLHAVALPGSITKPSFNPARPSSWSGPGWHKAWANRFRHFPHVVLLPDADGPGRALMGAARYDLTKADVDARILDMEPGKHDGSDIADTLLRGTYDGKSRREAKEMLRLIVAEQAGVLVAA